jgi:hypothetical protein
LSQVLGRVWEKRLPGTGKAGADLALADVVEDTIKKVRDEIEGMEGRALPSGRTFRGGKMRREWPRRH